MAITKVSRGLLSTGISDSSDSTAITLDSSERVGIGTTSPAEKLEVNGNIKFGDGHTIGDGAGDNLHITSGASENIVIDSLGGVTVISSNGTETARFDASGNVGIGVQPKTGGSTWQHVQFGGTGNIIARKSDSAVDAIFASNYYINSSDQDSYITTGDAARMFFNDDVISFSNAGSGSADAAISWNERMRIDSSGYVMVGKTSAVAAGAGVYLSPSGASFYTVDSSGSANTLHVYDNVDSAYRFYVRASGSLAGTIFATVTSISSTSDERLKENIKDLETGLTEIMALKPRRFDWKEGEGNGTKNNAGFIAQEIETVLPDLVGDYLHKELDDVKSVRMGDILPTLVKAVQEQQALIETQQTTIDDFKSRIETLEAGG